MNKSELESLHKKSSNHRKELESSPFAGCFFCKQIYILDEYPVKEWIDNSQTAICPKCGIDSVLPVNDDSNNTQDMLQEMWKHYFCRGVRYKCVDGEWVEDEEIEINWNKIKGEDNG